MKILVVGIGRSGTTLTYRIMQSNPHIKRYRLLETCVLNRFKDLDSLIKKKPFFKPKIKPGCCEKINYTRPNLVKPKLGEMDTTIVEYCEKWLDWFGDEARIVHIIRYPLDTLFSMIAKRGRALKSFKGPPTLDKIKLVPRSVREKVLKNYFSISPIYPEKISKLPKTITFKYEDLITNERMIPRIFEFCNLPVKTPNIQLRRTRVFGHRRSGFTVDRPIDNIVKVFNEICEGIKYEL